MAKLRNDDLFPEVRNPHGTCVINERCLIRTQEEYRVVSVSGVVLAQYAVSDRMAEAHAMVSLVDQGWADQNDVARVFGCSVRTLRRHQRRFEEGGLAALGRVAALYDRCRRFVPGNGPLQTHTQRPGGGINALEGLLLATWRKDTNLIQQ